MLSDKSLYVDGKTNRKVAGKTNHGGFGRIHKSILYDTDLTASARCIYASLAHQERSGKVSVGQRRLSQLLGFNRETIAKGISDLAGKGYISLSVIGNQRTNYVLTHPMFGAKVAASPAPLTSSPKPRCLNCSKPSKTVNDSGWCQYCRGYKDGQRENAA